MHFMARNSTDPYQSQGYALRPDPLTLFRGVPTTVNHQRDSPRAHRRTHSGSSLQFQAHKEASPAAAPLLKEGPAIETIDKEKADTVGKQPNENTHDCAAQHCKRVIVNVAGMKFETQFKTLNRLPSTLLGNPTKRQHHWNEEKQEFFFDRHRPSFPAILYYYQSGGRLKKPVEVPSDIFIEELEFYQLGDSVIDAFKVSEGFILDEPEPEMPENTVRRLIWETFEYPGSNVVSTVISLVSVIFILSSIVVFCVETLPQFKDSDCANQTFVGENGTVTWKMSFNYTHPLFIIESSCIVWFVLEIFIRFVVCPSKLKFWKNLVNWIDLLSIAPYFIFLLMFLVTQTCGSNTSRVLSVLRVLRVARIFKLSRFSDGLKILAKTMQVSMRELSMFVLFLGIGVVIFAGAIFYGEAQNPDSFFTSIPDAFWWAVISMTTVGYGDVYPVGVLGKLIGSMCVLTGLLAIALPVPVIVTNFNNIYRQTTGRGSKL